MQIKVTNQKIERTDSEKIVAGNTELFAYFDFSTKDWDSLGKVAYFRHLEDEVGYPMLVTSNRCKIPWEVVKKGFFTVMLFGMDATKTKRKITTTTAKVRVFASDKKLPHR